MRYFILSFKISMLAAIVGCGDTSEAPSSAGGNVTGTSAPVAVSADQPTERQSTTHVESAGTTNEQDTANIVDAETLLADALARARDEEKQVLVHIGHPG